MCCLHNAQHQYIYNSDRYPQPQHRGGCRIFEGGEGGGGYTQKVGGPAVAQYLKSLHGGSRGAGSAPGPYGDVHRQALSKRRTLKKYLIEFIFMDEAKSLCINRAPSEEENVGILDRRVQVRSEMDTLAVAEKDSTNQPRAERAQFLSAVIIVCDTDNVTG